MEWYNFQLFCKYCSSSSIHLEGICFWESCYHRLQADLLNLHFLHKEDIGIDKSRKTKLIHRRDQRSHIFTNGLLACMNTYGKMSLYRLALESHLGAVLHLQRTITISTSGELSAVSKNHFPAVLYHFKKPLETTTAPVPVLIFDLHFNYFNFHFETYFPTTCCIQVPKSTNENKSNWKPKGSKITATSK